ncbi:MAG TPA: hypothetical protein VEC93_10385, partial [Anaerolineae bacterium]|nr:hypothetical protein [Anaerolineae bacterium]
VTVTFPVMVNQGLAAGSHLTNTATITSSEIITPAAGSAILTILPAGTTDLYLPLIIKYLSFGQNNGNIPGRKERT